MADRELHLDPEPDHALDLLHDQQQGAARCVEEILDWIESEPADPRARRRRFTNGLWAVTFTADGGDWIVLWDEPEPGRPVVRHIGPTSSF